MPAVRSTLTVTLLPPLVSVHSVLHLCQPFIGYLIDIQRYGNTGVKSSLCGQKVSITNKNNGKTVIVPIEDACPGCANIDSIDLSVGAFTQIATEEEGEVPSMYSVLKSILGIHLYCRYSLLVLRRLKAHIRSITTFS